VRARAPPVCPESPWMSSDIVSLVDFFFTVLTFAIIGRALLSWFDPSFRTAVGQIIYSITEPIVGPIRRVVPSLGMFDISPIIAIFLIQILSRLIHRALLS
jgi:YggT family protein